MFGWIAEYMEGTIFDELDDSLRIVEYFIASVLDG